MRLTYGPTSYHRLGAVWPRRKLREPWVGRVRIRVVEGAVAGPWVPPAVVLGAVKLSDRTRYDVTLSDRTRYDIAISDRTRYDVTLSETGDTNG